MKHLIATLSLFAIILTATSCRDENPEVYNPADYSKASFVEVFDAFWNGMNNNYVFWDIDETDWDEAYKTYRPLFADLDITKGKDIRSGYTLFKEMTADLVDSHYTITFTGKTLSDSIIEPSLQRKELMDDYHDEIEDSHFYEVIPDIYLDKGALKGEVEGEEETFMIVAGTIENDILYIHFNEYNLKRLFESRTENEAQEVLDFYFDKLEQHQTLRGIIIDVRANSGGDIRDLNFFLGKHIDEKLHFAYTRGKSGEGRLDYTPWVPAYITPQENATKITVPIVALADANSVSSAELTTLAIRTLPNGYFVGERTWGAHGPLSQNLNFNGGQFSTAFMKVRTSSLMLKTVENQVLEGTGITPDIEVLHYEDDFENKIDSQLERAIELIKEKYTPENNNR